jgi:hypothetical protein
MKKGLYIQVSADAHLGDPHSIGYLKLNLKDMGLDERIKWGNEMIKEFWCSRLKPIPIVGEDLG